MNALDALFDANTEIAKAIAGAYELLLGGVPTEAGFTVLINNAVATNFGSGNPNTVFNSENIYINIFASLVQFNPTAGAAFDALTGGTASLLDAVTALYTKLVPTAAQTAEGLAFLTRPEGLAFYQQAAIDRGIPGNEGAAIVALAALVKVLVDQDLGLGDDINDLLAAVNNGSDAIPADGDLFTPIETADGTQFDGDDDAVGSIKLTTGTDSGPDFVGNDGNDLFEAPVQQSGLLPVQTLNNSDNIDGGAGIDTLTAQLVDIFTIPAGINGIEIINLEGVSPLLGIPLFPVTIDVINADSLDEVHFRSPTTTVTVNNITTALSATSVTDDVFGGTFTLNHVGPALDGTTDEIDVTVRNVGNGIGGPSTLIINGGYETTSITSNGPIANFTNFIGLAVGSSTVNVLGSASIDLTSVDFNVATLGLFDASAFGGQMVAADFMGTGDLEIRGSNQVDSYEVDTIGNALIALNGGNDDLGVGNGVVATVTGGDGDDDVEFFANVPAGTASFTSADSFDGGAGTDRLFIVADNGAVLLAGVGPNIVAVERIVHDTVGANDGADGNISADMALSGSALEIEFIGDYNDAGARRDISVTNLTNADTVIYTTLTDNGVDDLTLNQAVDGALDNLKLTMDSGAVGNVNSITDQLITGADIEAVTLTSTGLGTNVIGALDGFNSNMTVLGDADLLLTLGTFEYSFEDGLIDASLFTGDLTAAIDGGGDDITLLAGSGNDTLRVEGGSTDGNGAGIDITTGGADVITFDGATNDAVESLTAAGDNFHHVFGFTLDDQIIVDISGIEGGDLASTTDNQIDDSFENEFGTTFFMLDMAAGTLQDGTAANYVFIKFTTAVNTAGDDADSAFEEAIGLGTIDVDGNNEHLAAYYDLTNSQMVLITIDSGANTLIEQSDDIDVIATIGMSQADFDAFGLANINTVA